MDNDVRIVVDAENKSARALGAAAKGAKTVGDAANIASRQVKDMGDKLESTQMRARKLAEAEEKSADKARELARAAALLRTQIAEEGDATGKLSERLDRLTRDTRIAAFATDDYRRAANRASAEAREQARAYDRVADNARQAARAVALLGASTLLSPDGKKGGGRSIVDFLPGSLASLAGLFAKGGASAGSAAAGSGPEGLLAGLGLGAVGALAIGPLLGGAAGGAALLGAGAVGGGLGLAGAWMGDPDKYGARWTAMIDGLKKRWLDSSKQFAGPLDDSLKEVDRVIRDLPVERLAAAGKGFVGPLVQGAGGGITAAANGFADLAEKAQPVANVLGPKLERLGYDVGDAFRAIGRESQGGALALGDLVTAIGWTVRAAGGIIGTLEAWWEEEHKLLATTYELASAIPGASDAVSAFAKGLNFEDTTISVGRALGSMGDEADSAAVGVAHLGEALDALHDKEMRQFDASLAVAQGWLDLKKELADGKRTLDTTTQAGIDNARAIESQVVAAQRLHEQQGELNNDWAAADAQYAANIDRIRELAHAYGYTDEQVDALLASMGALDQKHPEPSVNVAGLQAASDGVGFLGRQLNNLVGYYTAHVKVDLPQGVSLGNLLHHAAGGPTSAGWSAVNDWGGAGVGEIMRLPNGSTVIPAGTGRQMARDIAAGGGGGGYATATEVRFSGDTDSAMAQWFMQAQREGKIQIYQKAIVGRR